MNLYAYCGNNPIGCIDPSGKYGRGTGFSNREWKRFNKSQQKAAERAEKAAGTLRGAAGKLRSGEKLNRSEQRAVKTFERAIGGDATSESLENVAGKLEGSAEALRDDGTLGYIANIEDGSKFSSNNVGAIAASGGILRLNRDNPGVAGGGRKFQHVLGHEALHHTADIRDQKLGGVKGYKYGLDANKDVFKRLPKERPDLAIKNPDNLLEFTY